MRTIMKPFVKAYLGKFHIQYSCCMIIRSLLVYLLTISKITFFILLFAACQSDENISAYPPFIDIEEAFVQSNKYLIQLEDEAIDDFIERFGWNMKKTGSGLRYMIRHDGHGKLASEGDRAVISYDIYLLSGDPVYSSDNNGHKSFIVGRGGVESGLEEGILLLNEGAKATFIMPHYLAYGVPGDKNKIPKRATIIYKLELLKLY